MEDDGGRERRAPRSGGAATAFSVDTQKPASAGYRKNGQMM
jgi:hypothetical protein